MAGGIQHQGIDWDGILDTYFRAKGAAESRNERAAQQSFEDRRIKVAEAQERRQAEQDGRAEQESRARVDNMRMDNERASREELAGVEKIQVNLQHALAAAPPQARGAIEERLFQLHQKYPGLRRVESTGPQSTPADVARIGAGANAERAALGMQDPREKLHGDLEAFAQLYPQLKPGSPEFARAYNKHQMALKRAGATNVSMGGGKILPASDAGELGEAAAAKAALDQTLADFEANVSSDGVVEQVGARIAAKVPNTKTSTYDATKNSATQVYGRYMEGGVLKDADFGRYDAQMPKPGDSLETARAKIAKAKQLLDIRDSEIRRAKGDAGYNVKPSAPAPGSAGRRIAAGVVAGADSVAPPTKTTAEEIERRGKARGWSDEQIEAYKARALKGQQ